MRQANGPYDRRGLVSRRPRPTLRPIGREREAKLAQLRELIAGLPEDETVVFQDQVDIDINLNIGSIGPNTRPIRSPAAYPERLSGAHLTPLRPICRFFLRLSLNLTESDFVGFFSRFETILAEPQAPLERCAWSAIAHSADF